MADARSVRVKPAFGGMNSEASPEYVPDVQAAVLENLLPRPGKVVLRGPISDDIDIGVSTYTYLEGAMVYNSSIRVSVNGTLVTFISGIVAGSSGIAPGRRFCSLGGYGYSAYKSVDTTRLVRWPGVGASTELTNGPNFAIDVTTHLSRLFTLRNLTEPNALSWSDPGGSPANTAAEWQDDVSGLTNLIIVGGREDEGVALGHVGKQLAILKDKSIWMLTGLTPATFAVNRVTSEWGCISTESVVDHDVGCFFLSNRGFAYFDGANVVDVSEDIRTEMLAAIRDAPLPYSGSTNRLSGAGLLPFARATAIGRDCIMLVIGREDTDTAVVPTIYFAGIYDARQRTWSKFASNAFVVGAPTYLIPTPASSHYVGSALGYDGASNLMYLDDLVAPESASSTFSGEDTVDGTTATITAASYSRVISLSSPGKTSQIQRLLLDYTFVVVADGETSVDCWSVSLVDGLGNVLLAPTAVEATILASGYTDDQRRAALVRKRFQTDVFVDCSEVQLRITLPTLDAAVTEVIAAEINDATIEFIPGRDRPIR